MNNNETSELRDYRIKHVNQIRKMVKDIRMNKKVRVPALYLLHTDFVFMDNNEKIKALEERIDMFFKDIDNRPLNWIDVWSTCVQSYDPDVIKAYLTTVDEKLVKEIADYLKLSEFSLGRVAKSIIKVDDKMWAKMANGTKTMKVHMREDARFTDATVTIFAAKQVMEIVTIERQRIVRGSQVEEVTTFPRESGPDGIKIKLIDGEEILFLGRYDNGKMGKLLIDYFKKGTK